LLDCILLGDSIALGLAQARPGCNVVAVSGITSERYVQTFLATRRARTVIISLGVNDGDGVATAHNLRRLRGTVSADIVYWLLAGGNPRTRDAVRSVASRYGDRLIDVAPLAGPGHIHPDRAGYAMLARKISGARGESSKQASARQDLLAPTQVYRALPNLKVWNGPDNVNGMPVNSPIRP